MSTYNFLQAVACAYISKYPEMSDICFVFPNKRSGTFFLKELSQNLGDLTVLSPEVMDISDFVKRVTGIEQAPSIDLLFRLYKIYASLTGRSSGLVSDESMIDFDRFAPWGEMVLNDFDEVEKYDVDARALFKNVRDNRNIAANFLSEEQLKIIERYFGYRPSASEAEGFWKTVVDDPTELKEKFVELWRLLPELFEGLIANLDSDGVAMEGTIFKRAVQKIESGDYSGLPWDRVVFVGFNMLSTTEARLFRALADLEAEDGEPYAEFFWDAAGPVIGPDVKSQSTAVKAMRLNIKNFPMPLWAREYIARADVAEITPEICVMASPSNSAQAKIAGMIINKLAGSDNILQPDTAIVLPDENLLMPLLHSLPPDMDSVNLTMGYPLRFTAVASFVHHLRRLQLRRREVGSETGYLSQDLLVFLAHPLVHVLAGTDKANEINSEITGHHLRVVTPSRIAGRSEILAEILRPLPPGVSVDQAVAYLDRVLARVYQSLDSSQSDLKTFNAKVEREQVAVYRMALSQILESVRHHGIEMNFNSLFHLIDRLIASKKVQFEGQPLRGLQVMGVLETRALDFKRLIILSMNDKVMPGGARRRTFLPDSLRHVYGLPVSSRAEELYSYYFYRLLSRAERAYLIYDARAGEGMRSGGKSRFLMQLEMLHARGKVKNRDFTFVLNSSTRSPKPIVKDENVLAKLENFRIEGSDCNLSASALTNYLQCPLKFYYQNVMKIGDDPSEVDYIDALTQGNIVHEAMLNLYFPGEDAQRKFLSASDHGMIVMQPDDLRRLLDDKERIEREVRRAVNKKHFKLDKIKDGAESLDRPLKGKVEMVANRLMRQIENLIRHDMMIAPLTLVGGEVGGKLHTSIGEIGNVNISYAIDRVDMADDITNPGCKIRIVDYKSGGAHVEADSFDDIFNGSYRAKQLFQLLFYAYLLEKQKDKVPAFADIEVLIYDSNRNAGIAVTPTIGSKKDKIRVDGYEKVRAFEVGGEPDGFEKRLADIVAEIFDKDHPFEPTADEDACAFCRMKPFCGKE